MVVTKRMIVAFAQAFENGTQKVVRWDDENGRHICVFCHADVDKDDPTTIWLTYHDFDEFYNQHDDFVLGASTTMILKYESLDGLK